MYRKRIGWALKTESGRKATEQMCGHGVPFMGTKTSSRSFPTSDLATVE
uniref:Uncharacterized protein n=2 Tax=Anguilla anguilla TaxID=7936 RepID=A0A0E9R3G3_ANGAN